MTLPKAFVWRRLHSLTGIWLVLFLIIHLVANSQAALFFGEDGQGFIKAANDIRNLPYLLAIEVGLLAIPFIIHIVWGIQYLMTSESNSISSDGSKPALPEYPRNQAYTWQRITSWILLVLITLHVVQMRFMEAPVSTQVGAQKYFVIRVHEDAGLFPLAERLDVKLLNHRQAQQEIENNASKELPEGNSAEALVEKQRISQEQNWKDAISSLPLNDEQLLVIAKNFGTAELLMVRETFKMPLMLVLYTVLVLSACFHAFNGLWTFCITWGITQSPDSQNKMRSFSTFLMCVIAFIGLAAIWGSYWINLKQ
ncbi:MAG: succinate dehydrogenase [Parachlamydiaceae bacterium]|nr:succinate dehydrogenase [Parachlamydiaceae bacterium]